MRSVTNPEVVAVDKKSVSSSLLRFDDLPPLEMIEDIFIFIAVDSLQVFGRFVPAHLYIVATIDSQVLNAYMVITRE